MSRVLCFKIHHTPDEIELSDYSKTSKSRQVGLRNWELCISEISFSLSSFWAKFKIFALKFWIWTGIIYFHFGKPIWKVMRIKKTILHGEFYTYSIASERNSIQTILRKRIQNLLIHGVLSRIGISSSSKPCWWWELSTFHQFKT